MKTMYCVSSGLTWAIVLFPNHEADSFLKIQCSFPCLAGHPAKYPTVKLVCMNSSWTSVSEDFMQLGEIKNKSSSRVSWG